MKTIKNNKMKTVEIKLKLGYKNISNYQMLTQDVKFFLPSGIVVEDMEIIDYNHTPKKYRRNEPVYGIHIEDECLRKYPNIKAASKATGVSYKSINACCNKVVGSAGGYHWQYVDEEIINSGHNVTIKNEVIYSLIDQLLEFNKYKQYIINEL